MLWQWKNLIFRLTKWKSLWAWCWKYHSNISTMINKIQLLTKYMKVSFLSNQLQVQLKTNRNQTRTQRRINLILTTHIVENLETEFLTMWTRSLLPNHQDPRNRNYMKNMWRHRRSLIRCSSHLSSLCLRCWRRYVYKIVLGWNPNKDIC